MFTLLQGFYGNKFISQFPTDEIYTTALRVWEIALKDISGEIMNLSINSLPERYPSWPPTVGEFKEICMAFKGSEKFKMWPQELMMIDSKSTYSNLNVNRLIDDGAFICKRLKEIYPELGFMKISNLFTRLKNTCKKFYPHLDDSDLIKELSKYSDEDIKEALLLEKVS
jgi:hypothetical protein